MDAPDTHIEHMREALALAERGLGHVSPNPMVGAVVVDASGVTIGRGWYAGPRGAPHAEVRRAPRGGGPGPRRDDVLVTSSPATITRRRHHAPTP